MRPLLSALFVCCCLVYGPATHMLQAQSTPPPAAEAASPPSADQAPPAANHAGADQQKAAEPQAKEGEAASPQKDSPPADADAAILDADGKPIEPPPCAHKDKECAKKRKALLHHKEPGMKVEDGTLTVDGWTGKARLNYDIHELKFLYVSIPGLGTVVASMQKFPNSVEQQNALDGKTLTLKTPDDHIVQLSSDATLIDKKERAFFVRLDTSYVQPGRFPTIGYGTVAQAPYAWPGARPMSAGEQKLSASAPPLPVSMQAKQVQLPCQKVNPGQKPTPVKVNGVTMLPEACKSTAPVVPAPAQPMSAIDSGSASPKPVD